MILYLDCETVKDRLLSVNAMVASDWRKGESSYLLCGVQPNGWEVPDGCSITHDQAARYGFRAVMVVMSLHEMANRSKYVVIWGAVRTMKAIARERELLGKDPGGWLHNQEVRCIARASAPLIGKRNPKSERDDDFVIPSIDVARDYFNVGQKGVHAVAAIHDALVAKGRFERP